MSGAYIHVQTQAPRSRRTEPEIIMRDVLFTAILAFAVLVGGTAAIGSELLMDKTARLERLSARLAASPKVIVLPMVTVTGRYADAAAPVASARVARAEAGETGVRVE
jgi:hypothetical protein